METIKIGRLTPANFSYCPLYMTFVEHLAVEENAITLFGLQFHIQISYKPHTNYPLHKKRSVCFK